MPPKAVDARRRINRNRCFRGHGPLLQKRRSFRRLVVHHGGIYNGPSPCSYATRAARRGPSAESHLSTKP
jgi:hypothetical protein